MSRSRNHGMVIATIVATSVASVALALATLSGFGNSGAGDLLVSSSPVASTLLVLIGVVVLTELELAHMGRQRPSRAARIPLPEAARLSERAA